jgi:hypothetical protein
VPHSTPRILNIIFSSGNQMDVAMEDRLASQLPIVHAYIALD